MPSQKNPNINSTCVGRSLTGKEREQLIVAASIMHMSRVAADSDFVNQERYNLCHLIMILLPFSEN